MPEKINRPTTKVIDNRILNLVLWPGMPGKGSQRTGY